MEKKIRLIILGLFIILVVGITSFFIYKKTDKVQHSRNDDHEHHAKNEKDSKHAEEEHNDSEEHLELTLSPEQVKRFEIKTITLTKSNFQQRITLPGQISLNENKITHVVSPVAGIVNEIFKNLGDFAVAGEPLATFQSREIADAKSAYIAALKDLTLKGEIYTREEALVKKNIITQIQFIQTANLFEKAKTELEQKKQKLLALNMTEEAIKELPEQKTQLNIHTIKSPIDGKIVERHLTHGETVSDGKQIFVVANLDTVWVNLAVPSEDLPKIKKDQKADISGHQYTMKRSGSIMYVSPVINEESRTGRAIIELDNLNMIWHPGDFVKVNVVLDEQSALLSVPNSAIQNIHGAPYVFVKISEGVFKAKPIQIKGSEQSDMVQIFEGLAENDEIVVENGFLLKAQLLKAEAEHSD